jgi:RNA polymerase sigma factor (sigma-70 family)
LLVVPTSDCVTFRQRNPAYYDGSGITAMSDSRRITASRAADTATVELSADSTVDILDRAKQGNWTAVQALVARVTPSVRRWARGRVPRHVRHHANTEDVVQDAVLNLLKGIKRVRYRSVGELQAYLRTSVVNRIRDLIRGTRRRGTPLELGDALRDSAPSPLETAIMHQELSAFLAALQRLRPADRQVIIWRIEIGYSVDEIADRLGKSKAAAAMTVSRAMARLAAELKIPAKA